MRLPEPGISIPASLALGVVLSAYPLPSVLAYARPEWLTLLVIFWILNHPTRVGIWTAFFTGLVLDLLYGDTLGLNALSLSVVAFLTRLCIRRARVLSLVQTSVLVFVLVGLGLLIRQTIYNLLDQPIDPLYYWLPALTSACFWPFVLMSLQRWRRSC